MFDTTDNEYKLETQISGLKYMPNYISKEGELELLGIIDKQPWLLDLKR